MSILSYCKTNLFFFFLGSVARNECIFSNAGERTIPAN